MSKLEINKAVTSFSLLGTNEIKFTLNNYLGKNVVLYFYPRDSTPGCTNEGIDFTTLYPDFKKKNAEIFGISRDSINSHEKFKKKISLSF